MFDSASDAHRPCDDKRLLIQAEIDGELGAAEAASLAAHVSGCAGCAEARRRLIEIAAAIRTGAPRHAAPAGLRDAIARRVASATPVVVPVRRPFPPRAGWVAGVALAASLAFVLWTAPLGKDGIAREIMSDHIRALQPGHLTDVVSEDRHTVRPWFDGRIDFAPPVRDLAASGFPLVGGRPDAVDGHVAAALAYRRDRHVIDLFIWPEPSRGDASPSLTAQGGYSLVHWRQGGMAFWAVSDVEADQLGRFVTLWREAP